MVELLCNYDFTNNIWYNLVLYIRKRLKVVGKRTAFSDNVARERAEIMAKHFSAILAAFKLASNALAVSQYIKRTALYDILHCIYRRNKRAY